MCLAYAAASSLGRWHYGTEVNGSHCQAGEGKGKRNCTEIWLIILTGVTVVRRHSINVEQGHCSVIVTSVVYVSDGNFKNQMCCADDVLNMNHPFCCVKASA